MSGPPGYHMVPISTTAVTMQPGITVPPGFWVASQGPVANCPAGLELLLPLDRIVCHQEVELLEAFTGWECKNKYAVKNQQGAQLYYAFEESDGCERFWCSNSRGFTLRLVNSANQEVLRIVRPFKCLAGDALCCCLGDCCKPLLHEASVQLPNGTHLGKVREYVQCCHPAYRVFDENDKVQLKIEGPICKWCQDDYHLSTTDGQSIGVIRKEWGGMARECWTKATDFSVQFPLDLDVKMKAVLLGATFLIDFVAYEESRKQNSSSSGGSS